jgi:type VI secretion system secreted protein Hcp
MPLTGYLKLEGESQGEIKGDCNQEGDDRKDHILVYGVDHEVYIPKDPNTGLPTGQRRHGPLSITKHTDIATPLLFQALASGEQMKTWEMKYFHISEKGQQEKYYSIKLEEAIVVSMRHYKPNTLDKESEPYKDMEDVQFTYSKITWEHVTGNKTAEDDWKKPKS